MNHFHSKEQGCTIKVYFRRKFFNSYYDHTRCLTHKVKICRCGYQVGWHNNEQSCKLFPKGKQDLIKIC